MGKAENEAIPPDAEALIRQLFSIQATLSAMFEGQTDVILDPDTAAPMLLGAAQKALHESEERFRRLAENALDVIFRWRIDPPGIEYLNPSVVNLTGYTPDEFTSNSALLMSIAHPDDRSKLQAMITGEIPFVPQEARIIHKDGRVVWIERRSSPVYDSMGKLIATEGIVRDITESKAAEDNLRYHAGLLDQLSDAVISTDLDFTIVSWNRAAERIYGWTALEAIGQHMGVFLPTTYYHDSPPDVIDSFLKDGFWQGVVLHTPKEGLPIPILSSVVMVKDATGKPTGSIGVNRDITASKAAEESLRASEELFRALFERSSIGKSLTGLDGKLIRVNQAFADLVGYSVEEMQQIEFAWITHPNELGVSQEAARSLITNDKQNLRFEKRYIHKNGGIVWADVSTTLLHSADGTPLHFLTSIVDISERKQVEEAMQQSERFALATINALSEHLCVVAESGNILTLNKAWREFADDNPPVLQHYGMGVNYLAVCDNAVGEGAAEAKLFAAGMREVMRAERDEFTMEYPCHSPDGEQRWFAATVTRFAGEGPLRVVVSHMNITERKAAVDRVQTSETRYRRLFEAAHDGILILNFATGLIDDANPFLLHLLGYSLEEILGKTLWEISPFKQITASRDAFIELRDAGYIRYEDLPIETKAGELVQVEFVSNVYDVNGSPVIQCNIRDISERKQAEQEISQRARYLSLINDISRRVTSVMDVGVLLETTAKLTQQSFGYDHVGIYIVDGLREGVLLKAKAGNYASKFPEGHYIKLGQGMIGWVVEHCQLLLSNDVSTEPRFYNPFSEEIIRAEIDVPIKIGDELLGILGIQSRHTNTFSENDIVVLETLADQLAIAIHNARLFAAESDQRAFSEALASIASSLNSTLDLNEVLNRVLEAVGQVLPHDAMSIMLAQDGMASVVSHTGYEERDLGDAVSKVSLVIANTPNLASMAETGHSFCVSNAHAYQGWLPNVATDWIGSSIGAPIHIGGEILGFINLDSAVPGYFNDGQGARLQAFAHQAAAAVKNAQLYHELETYSGILEEAVTKRTAELQATTHRVETILNSVGDALLVLDLDGHIQQVNPAFARQTGYIAADALGQNHHDLLKLEFGSKGDYQMLLSSLKPGGIWYGQSEVLRKDGSTYEADLTVAPVHDEGDKFHLLVVVIRDITLLKAAQRAKDEFVSNVSHELRTPITGIKLNHDMMSKNPERSPVYLARMGREIERLNLLIEDMLRLSRLEQGRAELVLVRIDLNALASQFVMDRRPIAVSRKIDIKYDETSGAGSIIADKGLITQALSVLVTNAVSYTQEGGEVIVSVVQSLEKGKIWSGLRVRDNGPGILPEEQSHLFERFFRGSVGRSSGSPGTGLGLTIVKNIMNQHKGHVEISSEGIPGKGVSFTLWLAEKDMDDEIR